MQISTYLLSCRFVDISVDVRVECIKKAKEFLQHHPDLAGDLAGKKASDPSTALESTLI